MHVQIMSMSISESSVDTLTTLQEHRFPAYLLLLVGVLGVGEPKDMRSWLAAASWAWGRGTASSTMGIRETWGRDEEARAKTRNIYSSHLR